MADAGTLRIPFSLRGIGGLINISISRNTEPEAIGYTVLSYGLPADFARDFPVCRATVSYPADGYAAIFGWTQLVRSTDNASGGFEMDPIAIYRDVATPFAWYGMRPELFDAPSRDPRANMDWEAHSFLCISPDAVLTRQVRAITGFSWGFTITGDQIDLTQPAMLDPQAWNEHLDLLRTDCPGGASRLGFLIPDRGMGPASPHARHHLSVSGMSAYPILGGSSGALPGEGGFLKSAGCQVAGADQPVQRSAVTPHHSRPLVAIELGEQGPVLSLLVQDRVTVGNLTAQLRMGNVELDCVLYRLGVAAEAMIRSAGCKLPQCVPERIAVRPVVHKTLVVAQIADCLPECGTIPGGAGREQLPRKLDKVVGSNASRGIAFAHWRASRQVEQPRRRRVRQCPTPRHPAVDLPIPAEERQCADAWHRQGIRRQLAAVDLGDIGQRPPALPAWPGNAVRENGDTAKLPDSRLIVNRRSQVETGPQQTRPPIGNHRGEPLARQPYKRCLISRHGPDALTNGSGARCSQTNR